MRPGGDCDRLGHTGSLMAEVERKRIRHEKRRERRIRGLIDLVPGLGSGQMEVMKNSTDVETIDKDYGP